MISALPKNFKIKGLVILALRRSVSELVVSELYIYYILLL